MRLKNGLLLGTLIAVLVSTGFFAGSNVSAKKPMLINAAGATFPYPLYSKWLHEYRNVDSDVTINYQSIGSGGGIRQLLDGTIDFGASDAPMKQNERDRAKMPVLHIPTVLGAVSVSYHVPGAGNYLKLEADVLADIFLGKITKWNDPRIATVNTEHALPNLSILVAYRSDGSGTTAIFTDYLAKISTEWKDQVGAGKAVKWPTGLGGKGNEGVAGLIKQTPGAIGYIELAYAKNNGLNVASIQNKSGEFIPPSIDGVSAAANDVFSRTPVKLDVSITDSTAKGAYPISGFTYLLIYEQLNGLKGQKIINFLKWAVGPGQEFAAALSYAPLPSKLIKTVNEKIGEIKLVE